MINRHLAGAVVMSLLVAVYMGFAVVYGVILLRDDSLIVQAMGVALMVLPLVGAWGLVTEWLFGVRAANLRSRLADEGLEPEEFQSTASGRPDRDVAQSLFSGFAEVVEANPERWQEWVRLAIAYDACGDRRRARWAMRTAIARSRQG
jgi:hypothetical protein